MFQRVITVMMAAMLGLALRMPASALGIGDAPPKIEVKEFVKGQPVKEFETGKIYVVEFWATWCPPCRVSIPHLTELAKKHKDVAFVGVSAFEDDQSKVKPFVAQMGDKMDYCVALDDVAEGAARDTGKMAVNWMKAAEQKGIPTAFIIDKTTHIAWIGRPMDMDKPLEQIEAGKWDIKAARADMDKQQAIEKKMAEVSQKFRSAGNDPAKRLAVLDDAIKSDPDMEPTLANIKFALMLNAQPDAPETIAYAARLTETVFKDDSAQLNSVAWNLVDPAQPKRGKKLRAVALKAALRADALEQNKDAAIADTLAKAYFDNGNTAKAIETQTRALKLAKGTEMEKDASLAQHLAEYKKAARP